jgi:hypothetical protein
MNRFFRWFFKDGEPEQSEPPKAADDHYAVRRSIPITPSPVTWPWDMGRTGQGDAGDYVAHLRARRDSPNTPKSERQQIKDLLFPVEYGQGPSLKTIADKYMKGDTRMKITINVEVESLTALANLVLNDPPKGVKILSFEETAEVTETHENSPTVAIPVTVQYTIRARVREYMDNVSGTDKVVSVYYEGNNDVQPAWRDVTVSRPLGGDAWTVFDVGKQEPRTFILSNIHIVKGPAA